MLTIVMKNHRQFLFNYLIVLVAIFSVITNAESKIALAPPLITLDVLDNDYFIFDIKDIANHSEAFRARYALDKFDGFGREYLLGPSTNYYYLTDLDKVSFEGYPIHSIFRESIKNKTVRDIRIKNENGKRSLWSLGACPDGGPGLYVMFYPIRVRSVRDSAPDFYCLTKVNNIPVNVIGLENTHFNLNMHLPYKDKVATLFDDIPSHYEQLRFLSITENKNFDFNSSYVADLYIKNRLPENNYNDMAFNLITQNIRSRDSSYANDLKMTDVFGGGHVGLDISFKNDHLGDFTPIRSFFDGYVNQVESLNNGSHSMGAHPRYGNFVTIFLTFDRDVSICKGVLVSRGEVMTLLIAHMHDVSIEPGTRITMGELIGIQGTTGASSAPHMHIEIFRGMVHLDRSRDGNGNIRNLIESDGSFKRTSLFCDPTFLYE